MRKFRLGITRDFVTQCGKFKYDMRLEMLSDNPNIDYELLPEATPKVKPHYLKDYDVVMTMGQSYFGADSFDENTSLAAIARFGVGYDNIDVAACTKNDIAVFITPEGVTIPVALSILTYVLSLSTKILHKDKLVRAGKWNEKAKYMGSGLIGRTIGSIGLGGIAREFFRMAKPLGIKEVAYDPYVTKEQGEQIGVDMIDLDTLLKISDFVCINCPLTESTYHLLGEKEISLMKPTAYIVNTARGQIIDQKALTKALKDRIIQGAALDVLEKEPVDMDDTILELDNVILSPHGLAWIDDLFKGNMEGDMRRILQVSKGCIPDSVVNKEVLNREGFLKKLAQFK